MFTMNINSGSNASSNSSFRYYSGLIIIALFSLWLVWHFVLSLEFSAPTNPNYPDSFAKNVHVMVMDKHGKPQYEFSSPIIYHYLINDRTDFSLPNVILYQENQSPWNITADHGEAFEGDNKITLWGRVFFHQPASSTNQETNIQTELLFLYPETQTASTPEFISAVQPFASVNGTGMTLNLNTHQLDLLSNVHGMYFPTGPKANEKKGPLYVTSNTAHLDKNTDIITFMGDAKLKQGPNSYAAPKIEYYIQQQTLVSPESTKGQTKIVIQPNSLQKGKSNG